MTRWVLIHNDTVLTEQFKKYKVNVILTQVDMSLHSDTESWIRANQSFLLLFNAARLAE